MMAPSETSVQTTNSRKTDTSHSAGVKVTTKAESTGITDNLELNPWYFRTVPGILKLIQLLFSIICMGCGSPVVTSYTNFFMFVVATYFVITLVLCVIYLFSIKKLLPKIPWLLIEFITTAVGTVLYFIVAVVQLAATNRKDYHYVLYHHGYYSSYIAAGCFGLFNFIAYAAGTFFLFMEWKDSKPATTTVTIPESTPNPATNSH
ncbi:MARVEL domain-containing protein [Caerostris darwini]|uniref:MARVEL domain-containing protein n=2 Tax=Caerostris TaxID=172845 RepID=A0AAV4UXK9_9ARAC|nr:MARVEL domain-containing protein [Caerostris extrusa]GIY62621.1 MARVEL domain-containing protein [Caerostris darwini]